MDGNGNGARRGAWGSRIGFILAAAGSAIGLGNIWKFPYITGENGGGLFVLIYLACIAVVGIPIMVAEIMIGRAAQKQPVAAFPELQGRPTAWAGIGWMGVVAGFLILSYYQVVAGWAMDYTLKSVTNFTKGIHADAAIEATKFRATASMDEMRDLLARKKGRHDSRDRVAGIRREAGPWEWRGFARFAAAMKEAAARGIDPAKARARLVEDPELRAQVEVTEPLARRMKATEDRAIAEARRYYDGLSDKEVRDQAETEKRRSLISNEVGDAFGSVFRDGWTASFWMALFMLMTILVVAGGISRGIERWCKILMPTLFLIILFMVIYGVFQRGFGEAMSFVFAPDATKFKTSGALEALGHAFFTLSLGMGAMITYGSYQRGRDNLATQSVTIAGLDTLIALMACMMMFPIIFSYGREPSSGPGLVFISMPLAFAEMGKGGMFLAILFFGLLVFAALTSAISLLEVVASYFIDVRGWSRSRAAWILGGVIFLFGVPSAFAGHPGFFMESWEPTYGKNFFDTIDYLASNWMLPLGGFLISIYAGWVMPRRFREAEMSGLGPALIFIWLWVVRLVAPFLVVFVIAHRVGIIELR